MGSWSPWVRKDPEAVCGENCGGPAVEERASWFWSSQTILASGFGGPNQVETCYEAGGPLWPLSCTAPEAFRWEEEVWVSCWCGCGRQGFQGRIVGSLRAEVVGRAGPWRVESKGFGCGQG